MNILIVDDQLSIRFLIAKKIKSLFVVNVLEADGVNQAIEHLNTGMVDLVICDYWMEDGYGSVISDYILKNLSKNIPLIIFSSDEEIVGKFLHEGNHEAVLKPSFEKLIAAIEKLAHTIPRK